MESHSLTKALVMNTTYRLNQLLNFFSNRRAKRVRTWMLIYGQPRSGTSYLLQKALAQSKCGIGDWELGRFIPILKLFDEESFNHFSTSELKQSILENVLRNGNPGAGRAIDLTVKQIDLSKAHFDFLCDVMGSAPTSILFLYRAPENWLPSAKKKFNLSHEEAKQLYKRSLQSFQLHGGTPIDYDDIKGHPYLADLGMETHDFDPKSKTEEIDEELQSLYRKFKAQLKSEA
ncbi:MAG: hypothetical protein RLP15_06400 [Cryomorphaceae bacterium]